MVTTIGYSCGYKTFISVDITSQYFVFLKVTNHVPSKIEDTCTENAPYVDGSSMDVLEEPSLTSLTRTPYKPNKKDVGVQTSIPTDVKLFISVATETDNNILITNKKTCGTKSNNQTSSETVDL